MGVDDIFIQGMESTSIGERYIAEKKETLNNWILHNSRISFKPPNPNSTQYGKQVALKSKTQPRQSADKPEPVNNYPPNQPEDMNIIIRYLKREPFIIKANTNDRILQIKDKIKAELNIPMGQQNLVINGKELDNHSTLNELNIVNDTTLRLVRAIVSTTTVSMTGNNGQQQIVTINPGDSVRDIKQRYSQSTGEDYNSIILMHNGHTLTDNDTISDFQLGPDDEIHVLIQPPGQKLYIQMDNCLFSSGYHYKFPNQDTDTYYRGGFQYFRPCPYQRLALDVLGQYDEGNDTWLGSSNSPGEWAVAYHGSLYIDYNTVMRDGLSIGNNFQLGVGYYCSTHIQTVEKYASIYHSNVTGKDYRVIIQSRINPGSLIPLYQNGQQCDLFLVENEQCIRCYGICYIEV